MGARTFKLKFGHRGANHPVKELRSSKVEITSQNHGFAVDPQSVPPDVEVTHLNLYDGTIEGLRHVSQAGVLRAVSSRGVARAARRGLPVRSVPGRDGESLVSPRRMPKRTDLNRILVIGSGPIVIGQACEFDYSGTQACKALRAEGLEVVLVNSNPATIMTDPELGRPHVRRAADRRGARAGDRARAARCHSADGGRADGAEPGRRAGRARHPREVWRAAHRRLRGRHPGGRGPAAVQGRDALDRHRRAGEPGRAGRRRRGHSGGDRRGARGRGADRVPHHHPAVLHARRRRRRHRVQRRGVPRDLPTAGCR